MSGIFISHSSRDNEYADELAERLRQQGFQSLFLDFDPADGIPAGRNWEQELYGRLRICSGVVLLCSTHSMASDWCFAEITHARALGKHLFPLVISPCELRPILRDTQVTDLTQDREAGFRRLWRGLREAGLDPTDAFAWDVNRPPYPGLMPFFAEDAGVFFGRDNDLRRCLDTLAQMSRYGGDRLLVLMGASGSGKSSLVRAGVIPYLKRMPSWLVLEPMRPQRAPIDELASVLSQAFEQAQQATDRQALTSRLGNSHDGRVLAEITAELQDCAGRSAAVVLLVIDQLEELVTTTDADVAAQFVGLLNGALTAEKGQFFCLATLRSDYLAALQIQPQWRHLTFRDLTLGPMTPEHFVEVIIKPAQVAGITLEDGLVEKMVRDTGTADALPLLAFTLNRLWRDCARDRRITLAEYTHGIGGLEGSIRQEAEGVLAALKPTAALLAELKRAFRLMVRVNEEGQYTRRLVHWSDLPAAARPLLERFVKARLLVSGHDETAAPTIEEAKRQRDEGTLEVAHEALFRAWDKLKHWLDEDRAFLLWRQRVEHETSTWRAAPEDQGLLLRGGQLAEAERWLTERREEIDASAQAFIRASHSQARRITWIWRGLGAATVIGLVIASFLAVLWWNQRQETLEQLINSYWNIGIADRDGERDALKAAHHFARIVDLTPSPAERDSALASTGMLSGGVELDGMFRLTAPPDGLVTTTNQSVAVIWRNKEAYLWELKSGMALTSVSHVGDVKDALIAANGLVASWGQDAIILLWGADQSPRELRHQRRVSGARLHADRTRLLSWSEDNTARIWDIASARETARFAHPEHIVGAGFFGSAHKVLTWSADAKVRIWDQARYEPIAVWTNEYVAAGAIVSPDTAALLSWSGRRVILHDLEQGTVLAAWSSPEAVDGALFLAQEPAVITWNEGAGLVRTWSTEDGTAYFDPFEHEGAISRVWLAPDGKRLVTAGANSRIAVWDVENGVLSAEAYHGVGNAVVRAVLNGDGARVLSWGEASGARLWDTGTMTPLSLPLLHTDATMGATFFDHDQGIVSWGGDAILRTWRRHPSAELTAPIPRSEVQAAAPPRTPAAAAPGVLVDSNLMQAIRDLDLADYDVLDRMALSLLLGSGTEARVLKWNTQQPSVSSPLTLDEKIRGAQFEASGSWVALWGASSLRLWDVESARPLSATLRSDVLFPKAVRGQEGLLVWDSDRARIWRWTVAHPPSAPSSVEWLQAISGTRMDDQDELQLLELAEWCLAVGKSQRRPLPMVCVP